MSLADQIIEHGPWKPGTIGLELLADTSGALIIPEAVNELRDELIAARALKELLGRFQVEALGAHGYDARIYTHCGTCGWEHEGDWEQPFGLAELVQRAREHGEVCK